MGKSVCQLKEEVFAHLGGGPVKTGEVAVTVELSDAQFEAAVSYTKRWFSAKKGFVVFRPVNFDPNTVEYTMRDDVVQVLDVVFQVPQDVAAFFSLGFFDIIPYGPQNIGQIGAGLTQYSGFEQLLEFNEKRKRIFSVEPQWQYNPQTRILYIASRSGGISGLMLVQAKLNDFDVSNLGGRDEELFFRYLLARCQIIVGRVRSKYDSYPTAGGTTSLDGKELIEEAKAEMEILDKEIYASQGPDMPITGG